MWPKAIRVCIRTYLIGGETITAKEFRKKTKEDLADPGVKHIKVGRYTVTPHAQNQMALRDIYTGEVVHNLCRKPVAKTEPKRDNRGRLGYQRYSESVMTVVNPESKKVASVRGYHDDEAEKMGIKNHRRYTKQSVMDAQRSKPKSTAKPSSSAKTRGAKSSTGTKSGATKRRSAGSYARGRTKANRRK